MRKSDKREAIEAAVITKYPVKKGQLKINKEKEFLQGNSA